MICAQCVFDFDLKIDKNLVFMTQDNNIIDQAELFLHHLKSQRTSIDNQID